MTDEWGWWAGRDDQSLNYGPFRTDKDAVVEALHVGAHGEEQIDGKWFLTVHVAKIKGWFFDCEECGDPDDACDGCAGALSPDELLRRPRAFRNAETVYVEAPNE